MTTTAQDWVPLAEQLADVLADRGALHDPAWRAALTAVPRHALVPSFYVQNPDFNWREVTAADPNYLAEVYRNQPLTTALGDLGRGIREPHSSSSQPSLMIRMLETLGVRAGHRVLEIGTGTGYNTGLMAHRIGADSVYSVDLAAELVEQARELLDRLGFTPWLQTSDGALGWPEHGPYDKIMATCSVPAIPWSWARQLSVGGHLLFDLKIGPSAGNLVLLERHIDRLEGRFVPGWANFMGIRRLGNQPRIEQSRPVDDSGAARTTSVEPEPWRNPILWFIARFAQPAGVSHGVTVDSDTRQPVATFLTAPDGSWCEITHAGEAGRYAVVEYGPTRLWSHIETADQWWRDAGQPGWDRLGLTVTEHEQHIWLDSPTGPGRWTLDGVPR
jgi:methyltransferase of ATP-grasp peptide maturase system